MCRTGALLTADARAGIYLLGNAQRAAHVKCGHRRDSCQLPGRRAALQAGTHPASLAGGAELLVIGHRGAFTAELQLGSLAAAARSLACGCACCHLLRAASVQPFMAAVAIAVAVCAQKMVQLRFKTGPWAVLALCFVRRSILRHRLCVSSCASVGDRGLRIRTAVSISVRTCERAQANAPQL